MIHLLLVPSYEEETCRRSESYESSFKPSHLPFIHLPVDVLLQLPETDLLTNMNLMTWTRTSERWAEL